MNRLLLLLPLLAISFCLTAQDLFPGRGTAFQDEIVPRVDIIIAATDLDAILAPGNEDSDVEYPATFMFTDAEGVDTVQQIGFRLRGNTSRYSAKKSFKVSFNSFTNQKWKGLEKINLNGEHNDPTVSRSKICWDLLKDMRVPGARANHVELYVNGDYYGLYANIEHIDEEFVDRRFGNKDGNLYKCLYPADLAYLGENPDLYKFTENGRRAYDLQNNSDTDDYSDLANFIGVINQASISDLPCELEAIFNVDTYLRTMAFDVIVGNWDGYAFNQNNFYLYHNTATDRFEYIPFDLDNTLGIDWLNRDWAERDIYNWPSGSTDRPLFERILEVPDYRARYSYYIETFLAEDFKPINLFPEFDALQAKLLPFVTEDDYYPLDYGFSLTDFHNAFDGETDYFQTDYGLKSYVIARRTNALAQLEDLNPAPYLFGARSSMASVGQQLSFQVNVQGDENINQVQLCYQLPGQSFTCVNMEDFGSTGDGLPDDDEYGIFLSPLSSAGTIEYYFTATDNQNATNRHPACGNFTLVVSSGGLQLAINEFMASNATTVTDEADEFDDWLEIHNYSDQSISLTGRYLSDNPDNPTKWAFPDMSISAGAFLLVWIDDDVEQGPLHTDFKLDAAGEFIGIFDTDAAGNVLIDGTEFGPQETDAAVGRLPNGTGALQAVNPTPGASNEPLSTGEGIAIKPFAVYPNPVNSWLTIEAPEGGQYEAQLFNLAGQMMQQYHWNGQATQWDLQVPAGMYLLLINENGQAIFSTKVVKE
jgi:hypothetical protein